MRLRARLYLDVFRPEDGLRPAQQFAWIMDNRFETAGWAESS